MNLRLLSHVLLPSLRALSFPFFLCESSLDPFSLRPLEEKKSETEGMEREPPTFGSKLHRFVSNHLSNDCTTIAHVAGASHGNGTNREYGRNVARPHVCAGATSGLRRRNLNDAACYMFTPSKENCLS